MKSYPGHLLHKAMSRAENHIWPDQGAAANVARAEEVAIVEATPETDLMPGGLHIGHGAIDNPTRIGTESGTYMPCVQPGT